MLSRVADSLYWMSRYLERTDGILRMLKMNYASSQDDLGEFSWKPVLQIFTYMNEGEANAIAFQSRAVLQYMVTERENPNSVFNIVTHARENARSIQDHITKEMWQCLNDYYHAVRNEHLLIRLEREDLIKHGLLYYGTTDITMARGESYVFLTMGKFLERALQSADILDVKFSDVNFDFSKTDTTYWKYLLLSISGYELYLKTYRSGFEPRKVVEQIVLNDNFPRSVKYSINRLHGYFERIRNQGNTKANEKMQFMIGRLRSHINYSTVEMIEEEGLHLYLLRVKKELRDIANALNQYYFAYS